MLSEIRKVRDILTPAERRKAAWMLVLVVLMALAETLGVLSIMPFLSVLGRPAVIHENPLLQMAFAHWQFHDERDFIIALGLASIAIVIASSLFKTITLHALNRFVHLERHSISARLLSRYLRQPYEFFLARNSSILGKNLLSEADQLLFELIQPLSQLFAQGAIVLAMALLIFLYDPATAICIVLVLGTLYATIYGLVRKRLERIGLERQAANGRRYQAANEALSGIKDVKITHSAAAYEAQFNQSSREYSRHTATNETLAQSPLYLVEATGYSMLIVVALTLLLRSNDIAQVLPALGLYGFAAYRMLPAAQIMYRGFAKLHFSSSTLDAIHRDLALPGEPAGTGDTILAPRKDIRLRGIRYAYPSTPDKLVFDGFDLVVPANASIGIAGRSGAGKSTLMDLLLGLLHPQDGTLEIDGVAVDAHNAAAWQRAIGYVPQHIFLADASVAENIAFGVPRDKIDMHAVERAARAAQIHDFVIDELPRGYDTDVGDRGIRLSGGQRQRIGIARALYRDPPVLFLDEATSALDAQTEEALNEAIRKLSGSKTIVVIAHKESSLRGCGEMIQINQKTNHTAESKTLLPKLPAKDE
ncbi:MAG TPA: ABC transporter ATP-binding protein [Telluria sp.]|jgi:ABC-type multidrug transport system fused ATPase/permease subunit